MRNKSTFINEINPNLQIYYILNSKLRIFTDY